MKDNNNIDKIINFAKEYDSYLVPAVLATSFGAIGANRAMPDHKLTGALLGAIRGGGTGLGILGGRFLGKKIGSEAFKQYKNRHRDWFDYMDERINNPNKNINLAESTEDFIKRIGAETGGAVLGGISGGFLSRKIIDEIYDEFLGKEYLDKIYGTNT